MSEDNWVATRPKLINIISVTMVFKLEINEVVSTLSVVGIIVVNEVCLFSITWLTISSNCFILPSEGFMLVIMSI